MGANLKREGRNQKHKEGRKGFSKHREGSSELKRRRKGNEKAVICTTLAWADYVQHFSFNFATFNWWWETVEKSTDISWLKKIKIRGLFLPKTSFLPFQTHSFIFPTSTFPAFLSIILELGFKGETSSISLSSSSSTNLPIPPPSHEDDDLWDNPWSWNL